MESIKHVPPLICDPDDLVHTHSITSGESTINPAACSVVSAVSSQACSLLYSANIYKEFCLEVLCLYKHKVKQASSEGLEVNTTYSTWYLKSSTLSSCWCLCGFFHFFLKCKTLQNRVWIWGPLLTRKVKQMEEPWMCFDLKIHATGCKFDIINENGWHYQFNTLNYDFLYYWYNSESEKYTIRLHISLVQQGVGPLPFPFKKRNTCNLWPYCRPEMGWCYSTHLSVPLSQPSPHWPLYGQMHGT